MFLKHLLLSNTENPVLSGHLKQGKTKVFIENDSLMEVKCIAFCNTFDLR